MRARDLSFDADTLLVRPWVDPVVDRIGHDPRSAYVERFWLGVLGPTATFFLRHLAHRLDDAPDGFELGLTDCSVALGLGTSQTAGSALPRTIGRCCQFGAGRLVGPAVLDVRRRLPPLRSRQLRRLPTGVQADHARWVEARPAAVAAADLRERAQRLALSLVELGEDRDGTERQLHRWRFHPALASEATTWAFEVDAARRPDADAPSAHGHDDADHQPEADGGHRARGADDDGSAPTTARSPDHLSGPIGDQAAAG